MKITGALLVAAVALGSVQSAQAADPGLVQRFSFSTTGDAPGCDDGALVAVAIDVDVIVRVVERGDGTRMTYWTVYGTGVDADGVEYIINNTVMIDDPPDSDTSKERLFRRVISKGSDDNRLLDVTFAIDGDGNFIELLTIDVKCIG